MIIDNTFDLRLPPSRARVGYDPRAGMVLAERRKEAGISDATVSAAPAGLDAQQIVLWELGTLAALDLEVTPQDWTHSR